MNKQTNNVTKTVKSKEIIMKKLLAITTAISALALQQVTAQVTAVNIGTANPPATLGAYTMNPYTPASIVGAFQATVPSTWATWGQGYTGTVWEGNGGTSVTLDLSAGTEAVDFYEEPNQFANFYMTATDSSGATVTTLINGYYGSSGVGFYEDVPGGPDYLSQITVTATDPTGYAIGEFGINGGTIQGYVGTPDTGWTLAYMTLAGAGLFFAQRRFAGSAAL